MFVFLKLCLAHLIADFVLQFNWLYRLKLKSIRGQFLHAFIHGLTALLLLFPYLGKPFIWLFVLLVSTAHLFQDVLKCRWMVRQRYFFHIFAADQALHLLLLSTILFFPVSSQKLGFPDLPALNFFYTNHVWTIYLIAFLAATFSGSFVLNALGIAYLKNTRPDHFITGVEMAHGIFERSVVGSIFLFASSPVVFALSPAVGVVRFGFKRLREIRDYALSFVYAAFVGLVFRMVV